MSRLTPQSQFDTILRDLLSGYDTGDKYVYALCWKCKRVIYSGETDCLSPGGLKELGHEKHYILLSHLINFPPERLQQLADETQMSEKERKIRNLEMELEKLRNS